MSGTGAVRMVALLAAAASCRAAAQLPDPTRPASYVSAQPVIVTPEARTEWTLRSIRISPSKRSALLNGRTVVRGQRIDGATVVDIQHAHVVIEERGRQVTLRLFQPVTKSKSKEPGR